MAQEELVRGQDCAEARELATATPPPHSLRRKIQNS
jgi:hypothetical protein